MAQRSYIERTNKRFAERSSQRLKRDLDMFSDEKANEIVNEIFDAYAEDGDKNFFRAGYRDDTLFLDEDYVDKMESFKKEEREKKTGSVAEKLGKLKNFIPKVDLKSIARKEEELDDDFKENFADENSVTGEEEQEVVETETTKEEQMAQDDFVEEADAEEELEEEEVEPEVEEAEPEAHEELEDEVEPEVEEVKPEVYEELEDEAEPDVEDETEDGQVTDEPENEPTIVITSINRKVKDEVIKEPNPKEDDDMRREFFDDEEEVQAVPRRRRKVAEEPVEETVKTEEPVETTDVEENDEEEKKNKFGNFFKRKNSDPFDDDYDDEDYDDDDYFDDDYDDYYEERSVVGKVVSALVIIALICTTAFFAASSYTNAKKLESANSQIEELKNGTAGGSSEEINSLKAQIDQLTAENTRLKNGGTATEPVSTVTPGTTATGTPSTTITGQAPAEQGSTPTANATTYTVKQGDTGSKICKAVYGQYSDELWNKILSANNMNTNSTYHPGDVLQIPQQ